MRITNPCSVMYLSCLKTVTDGEVTVSFHASSKAILNDANLLTATSSFTNRLNKSDNGVSSAIFSEKNKTKKSVYMMYVLIVNHLLQQIDYRSIGNTRIACRKF